MTKRILVVAATATLLLLNGRTARASDENAPACSLLTRADISRAGRGDAIRQQFKWPVTGGEASSCNYGDGTVSVVLVTGSRAEQGWSDYFKKQVKVDVKKEPVPGFGRSAYYMFPKPQIAMIVVSGRNHTIGITIVTHYGEKGESYKPTLLALAKAASSRAH